MAQNTLREALSAYWGEQLLDIKAKADAYTAEFRRQTLRQQTFPGVSVAPKAEADAYLATHPQFYTTGIEINGLRNIVNGIVKENLMYDNHKCCTGTPESAEQWAERTAIEAERAARAARAERKAAKKAKRAQREREADIDFALYALNDVAENGTDEARVEAANSILNHYRTEY